MFVTPRARFVLLLVILVILAVTVGGVSLLTLYQSHLTSEGERLAAMAKSQARLVLTFHQWEHKVTDNPKELQQRLVEFLTTTHQGWYEGLGKTGEIAFARREGEQIVYLFRQRHGSLVVPRPVPWSEVGIATPMRLALSGQSGVIIGPDYRGEEVHAAYEAIPELNLGLVVKLDMAEMREPVYHAISHAVQISVLLILVGAVFFTRIAEGVIRRIQETEEKLSITLDSIGDGVIVTDGHGGVVRMNPVAESLTGWRMDEARGQPLEQVFHIVNFQTRQIVVNPAQMVIQTGRVVGLANHTVLIARDGTERHIADSGSPVRDGLGRLFGVVLVFRDVTQEYRMLLALRKGEERIRLLLELQQESHLYNEREVCDRAVEIAVQLTESQVGYLHIVHEDQRSVALTSWNREALKQCTAVCDHNYALEGAGLWAESIRRKEPVVHNDFVELAARPGYPEGHVTVLRHMSVPVVEGERVVLVMGVGNKNNPYDHHDVQQLRLVAEGVQKILARHRAVEHLRQSRLALDEAQTIAHLGSWSWNLLDTSWEISAGLCRILGLAEVRPRLEWEELLERIHPEDRERFERLIALVRDARHSSSDEVRIMRASGQEMILLVRAVFWEQSQVTGSRAIRAAQIAGTMQDITVSKHREKEFLRMNRALTALGMASQALLKAVDEEMFISQVCQLIVEQAGYRLAWVGMAMEDADKTVKPVAWYGAGGHEYPDSLGITWSDTVSGQGPTGTAIRTGKPTLARHIPDDPTFEQWRSRAMSLGFSSSLALPLFLNQQTIGALNIYASEPDAFDAAEIGFLSDLANTLSMGIGSLRRLMRETRMESQLRQAQKMEAIGTLAGGIAHDFNNILGVIIGYTELVMKQFIPEEQSHQDLREVLTASLRARDLIAQLLTFSRQTDLEDGVIALVPLVKEALRFMRAVIPATVRLTTQLPERELTVIGNPTRIHQILMNLCTNGVQAMHHRTGGELTIRLEEIQVSEDLDTALSLSAGRYVRIQVEDNGIGIPSEVLPRIFDPFFTTKGVGEGTGLGLSVVHGHVTAMQGRILVESRVDAGSCFHIYLPLETKMLERRRRQRDGGTSGQFGLEVLVVDDEPQLVAVLAEHLKRLGCQPVCALKAEEAVDLVAANPDRFDLAITDQTMPDATGEVLLRALHKLAPHLPVVLTSGYRNPFSTQELHAVGFWDFLPKPILSGDLESLLTRFSAQI
ncbi:MAG: GAF domain-containing protein [Magnetococcales bacterium]|nr:GAF domain-containing protein [Magnetococcales bacterium]NGZ07651.1 GAF domain-containing protein [Magnetococcales bacterium]